MSFSKLNFSKRVAACLLGGLLASTSFVPTAYAADANKKEEKEINRSVELSAMVFPVFDKDRRLVNYLFVNARMLVSDGKGIWEYRDKAHIVRDIVLRAAHRESVHLKGNFTRIDEEKAEKLFIETVNKELGEEAFTSVTFLQVASQELG